MNIPEFIDERGAAEALAIAPRTLQCWRICGKGPKFVKLGRSVRYRKVDLLDWIKAGTHENTSTAREVLHG